MTHLWPLKAPPRAMAFVWWPLWIFNMDDFQQQKKILVNGSPMCLADAKSTDHLMFNSKTAQKLRCSILVWFDASWVIPQKLINMFDDWS